MAPVPPGPYPPQPLRRRRRIHPGALVRDAPDSPHHDLAGVGGELYFAFAEKDQSAAPEVVDRFRDELERNGVSGVVERLPGTRTGSRWQTFRSTTATQPNGTSSGRSTYWRRNLSHEPVEA